MGFHLLGNIWKLVVDNSKLNGMSEKRLGLKKKKATTTKRCGLVLSPIPNIICVFLACCVPYSKDDIHKK
jgi:hypothetical protein